MKKFLIALLLFPSFALAAGLTLPQGGLGTTTVPTNYVLIGLNPNRITAVATSSLGLATSLTGGTAGMITSWLTNTTLTATSGPTAGYFFGTSTSIASFFPLASTTGLTNTGSTWLTTITNAILGTDGNGKVISTTTPTALTFNATQSNATSTFAGGINTNTLNVAGAGTSTTIVGNIHILGNAQIDGGAFYVISLTMGGDLNMATHNITNVGGLTGTFITAIVNGGTATSTQVTNGVNFFDGTRITSGTNLVFTGTNFGVGTSTPGSLFSIGGVANFTTSTTTTYGTGGFNIAAGCFAIAGTCLSSGSSISGGTNGMLAAWTGASTLTATGTPTFASFVATSTTATSTAANGINITGGCVAKSGNCIPVMTQSVVTGSRAFATAYRNTTGYPLGISIAAHDFSFATLQLLCYSDSSASPSVIVAASQAGALGNNVDCTFMVPNGYYYQATQNGIAAAIDVWTEWTIGQ